MITFLNDSSINDGQQPVPCSVGLLITPDIFHA